jgi:hypothetical protein
MHANTGRRDNPVTRCVRTACRVLCREQKRRPTLAQVLFDHFVGTYED